MIDGGGKIGGPPGVPPPVAPEATKDSSGAAAAKPATPQAVTDRFEKSGTQRSRGGVAPQPMGHELSGSTDLLRLARENPAQARQMVATLAAQSATTLAEVERELNAARRMLEELARKRFSKEARRQKSDELRKQRDRIAALKLRMSMGARKSALLQQLAGKLGDPRLDDELDRLLRDHSKLKTDWGKHHHLLSIGGSFYGDDAETPDHLQQVVKAEIRGIGRGEEAGNALRDISPRRVISELIARTIDGSVRTERADHGEAQRGELGRSMQGYSMIAGLIEDALGRDPLGEDE